ncbi:MAG: rhodanese-like domain-containing protein [Mycoplasmoidaceae bacterium]
MKQKIVIDVRSEIEFEKDHIEKSINIPLDILLNNEIEFLENKIVYLYCLSGNRSKTAFDFLNKKKIECIDLGSIDNAKKILSTYNIKKINY